MITDFNIFDEKLSQLPDQKLLINTINAYSYNISQKDPDFNTALKNSDILLPDGISIVYAFRFLKNIKFNKIAGADLFFYEMNRLEEKGGSCFFLGSSEKNLSSITTKAKKEFPTVKIDTYSPPFKEAFTDQDNQIMIEKINTFHPDVLFIGMTAPKQEKWANKHKDLLDVKHICSIGAVFDFYAGSIKRAPKWLIQLGLEWAYRLIIEPKRMWRRYLIGNVIFIFSILKEKSKLIIR